MKSLQKLSLLLISVFLFTACSEETKQELKEAADAVTAESKEQLFVMVDKAKGKVAETAEVVKSKTQEIADKAFKEVAEVKEAAAEKMGKVIQDTSEEVTELKAATDAKLQGMFKQKEEAPADLE